MTEELQRLVLRVDANINRYERKLRRMEGVARGSTRRVESRFDTMSRNINRAGMRFAGQFTAAIAGIASVSAISRASLATLQYAQDLESASDRIGFSVERLQEYRFAADQSGIATRALDMGLQRFSRRVAEAYQGTGELSGTLEQYGIQLRNTDGSMRAINDIFRDYADAISNADTNSEALRMAFKAFDSEGAALVEFLREGSAGLDRFSESAREAGVVLEEHLVRQGAEAQRTINRLKMSIGADFNRTVLENVENLERLAEVLGDIARFGVQAGAAIGGFFSNLDDLRRRRDAIGEEDQIAEQMRGLADELRSTTRNPTRHEVDQMVIGLRLPEDEQRRVREQVRELIGEDVRLNARISEQSRADIADFFDGISEGLLRRRALPPPETEEDNEPPPPRRTGTNLQDQEAARRRESDKDAAREAQRELNSQRRRDLRDLLAEEAESKREIELQIARDSAAAYLEAMEQNREKFTRLFSDTMTNGVRAAFEGDLPEYAARRMQEAFYNRLSVLFEQLAGTIFDASRGKGGSGNFLSTIASAIFGGGRASGGPVSAGMAYKVGEAGPEYFVPSQRGVIVPNSNMGRSSSGAVRERVVVVTVDKSDYFNTAVQEAATPIGVRAVQESLGRVPSVVNKGLSDGVITPPSFAG